jgi:hypothetical protein
LVLACSSLKYRYDVAVAGSLKFVFIATVFDKSGLLDYSDWKWIDYPPMPTDLKFGIISSSLIVSIGLLYKHILDRQLEINKPLTFLIKKARSLLNGL